MGIFPSTILNSNITKTISNYTLCTSLWVVAKISQKIKHKAKTNFIIRQACYYIALVWWIKVNN